ncbi:hypothetical protein OSB04_031946 [Centaurea solstitialis]|uniref:DUF4283 domain-containing protein n=1 Tax=Centaurea solstitialis TaxID=347529 RepID=A0AA38SVM3_9ASTR|nr:hypothetical protein OSB04_031946 [Centaurea solstitialis]
MGDPDPTMVVTDVTNDLSDDDVSEESQDDKPHGRVSVFDRLETDAQLKFNSAEMNFAKAVGSADAAALSFFPLASKAQSCIHIPKELATEVIKTHRSTLYGYFLGPQLHFLLVERYVKAAWGKFGFIEAMMNNNGIYFSKFNDIGGSNQVVEAGPLMIRVGELKRELQVIIPSLSGGEDVRVLIKVEYLWEPTQCSHCLVFGHKTATCVKAVVAQKNKGKAGSGMIGPSASVDMRREEHVREERGVRHFSAPLDVPLKTILNNPNRFTPLEEGKEAKETKGDGSKEKKRSSPTVVIRKLTDAPKKPGGVSRTARLDPTGSSRPSARLEDSGKSKSHHRWAWVSNQAQSAHGTRIIVSWDQSLVDIMVLESHSQFMHCQVKFRDSQDMFFVSFVYGANRGSDRQGLWSRRDQSRHNCDMTNFAAFVEDVELFDIRFMGIHHTWCQKPKEETGLRRKLDRILANTSFTSVFQDCTARFLPRGLSDHSPGVASFKGDICKRNFGFKFDNFLVTNAQFLNIVKSCWSTDVGGTFMFKVTSKLKLLKTPLRKLPSLYGNLTENTQSLKHELDTVQLAMDLDPSNDVIREDLEHVWVAYEQACWNDMSASRQRAKVKWLMEGDANTKYFHHVVKEKRNAHHIHSVCNSAGVFVYDLEVATAFLDHFKSIIGTHDDTVNPLMPMDLFTNKLNVTPH